MFATILSLALLADRPHAPELKVGDVIELHNEPAPAPVPSPVRPSPQSIVPPPPPPPAPAVPMPAPAVQGDPYGFGAWLNAQRAARGLGPVWCDGGLCNDAAANSSRGFGHAFRGNARRQNAGVGSGSAVWPMWVASPAHASALFDPSITRYGIAYVNGVWTFNAN